MRAGSLPRSIARSLPTAAIEPNHAPDGLDEPAIDALLNEVSVDVTAAQVRLSLLSTDAVEQRRVRRHDRPVVRLLARAVATHGVPVTPDEGEAA